MAIDAMNKGLQTDSGAERFSRRGAKRRKMSKAQKNMAIKCYLLLALPIIGFLVFTIYPIFWSFKWSLFSFTSPTGVNARFVGLENFKTMFTTDFTYWRLWGNTFIMALMKMPIEITLAMILAVILTNTKKLSGFFRSMYYLPSVVSMAIIGLLFSNIFSYFGIANGLLERFGLISEPVDWFATKWSSFTCITIASIWSSFGINVMYLMAAMTNVPKELYESAQIDGATGIKAFFKITLPMIAPVFQTIILLSLIGTLSVGELVLVLTNGAPGGQSFSVMSYLTRTFMPGFTTSTSPALGYGCALSVSTTIIFGIIAFSYNKLSKRLSETM